MVLALVVAATVSAQVKVSGYTQIRCADTSIEDDDYEFDIRRCTIGISAPINDDGTEIKLGAELAGLDDEDGEFELDEAVITHPLNAEWEARVGYSDAIFGYDLSYSSSRRLPFERAQATRRLFRGGKDTGIYCMYEPQNGGIGTPSGVVGITNDIEDTADWFDEHDTSFAFVGGLNWALPNNGQAGLSYMSSSREGTIGGVRTEWDDYVWGAHVRYNSNSNFAFQAEYLGGDQQEVGVSGWYGLLELRPNSGDTAFFYRYDTYDDGDPDDYCRHTAGVAMEVGSQSRVTLQYEDIDDEGVDGSTFGIQWQVKYATK